MGGSDLSRIDLATNGPRVLAASDDPDVALAIRQELAPHHKVFCEKIVAGVRRGDRTAMNLYPRLVRAIGADHDLTGVLIAQLGVQSLDAARRIMDLAREADAEDSDALYERSMRFVTEYRRRHGLPPLLESREVSHADVLEEGSTLTNGHANGSSGTVPTLRSNGSGPAGNGSGAGH